MTLIYRRDKAGPLTIEEVDGNFEDLDKRIHILETEGIRAEGIAQILQIGDSLEIKGTRGTVFGRFALPRFIPQARGHWKTGVEYRITDWVQMGKKLYCCREPHLSTAFEDDLKTSYWQLVMEW